MRPPGTEAAEDEIEVTDVVTGDDRAAGHGYVLRAVHPDPQVEYPEQQLRRDEHGRIDDLWHRRQR